jgi:hypothetical protein
MKTQDTIKKESRYMIAWQKSINLKGSAANMAANVERRQMLRCWVEYTIATERGYSVAAWVRPTLLKAVAATASADLRALLPAIPTKVLIEAVRMDGTLNVPAIGRAMAAELANNANTVVAVAQAAQKAMTDAKHEAQKAAKKAALAAKKAAKKAAAEYATNNTCGQI